MTITVWTLPESKSQSDIPAPDYIDAVDAIFKAVESNAAPMNVMAALKELARDDKHITLHADLLIDLFEVHLANIAQKA